MDKIDNRGGTKMETTSYKGTNQMIVGIVFGVITFWLFAQALVNVVPAVREDLGLTGGTVNIAISLTALFSGMFIVAAGGLADKIGRKKVTDIGLVLSIMGSLCLVFAQGATLLILGRVLQGLSAACIMPATIALIKAYFEGEERQRALSYWSIGSWGGTGFASFAGGTIATYLGWRWIYVFSIIFALLSFWLLKDTLESKEDSNGPFSFDYSGLGIFIITMIALNVFITYGGDFGWTSLITIGLLIFTIISTFVFIKVEKEHDIALIDFSLFENRAYSGATISNFLLNAIAGTLVVANTYVQVGRHFNAFQSGILSLGYLVTVLSMIRVGEKILQKAGAKAPMLWGSVITTAGVAIMGFTFLPDIIYTAVVFIGFALFGLGLGIYATPSTDTSVANAPSDKVGSAAGIYKMASSLGGAFGVSISITVYSSIAANGNLEVAATTGFIVNVLFGVLCILSVIFLIPRETGKSRL